MGGGVWHSLFILGIKPPHFGYTHIASAEKSALFSFHSIKVFLPVRSFVSYL